MEAAYPRAPDGNGFSRAARRLRGPVRRRGRASRARGRDGGRSARRERRTTWRPLPDRFRSRRARSWRSAAATACCSPLWRRAASGNGATASRSPSGRSSSRRGGRRSSGWRASTARRSPRRTARTTWGCSPMCWSTCRTRRPLLRETARVAGAVVVEVPLEDNRSASRAGGAARARGGRAPAPLLAGGRARAGRSAGLRVVEELADPLPLRCTPTGRRGRARSAKAVLKAAIRRAAFTAAPARAERLFTVHYACLLSPQH